MSESKLPPKTPVPPPAPAEEEVQPWMGQEMTLTGQPVEPQIVRPVTKAAGEAWIGRENTLVGTPAPTTPTEAAPWMGREQTMVGQPVAPAAAPAMPAGEAWMGNERTLLGQPTSAAKTPAPAGDKTSPTKGPRTTTGFDDGWHFSGRKGPLTGQTIGDFEVGGIIGEGGMGTVYRARQLSLRRRAALKVLPGALASDERLRARFQQEAQTASLIQCPNVVQVYAAGEIEGLSYFAMEYVEGTDLSDIIRKRQGESQPFTPDEAARYIIQAAKGLAEAARFNVVHRDIKPANLMVTSKGVIKIADFGIAKVAGTHGLTMTGTAVGTPAYCSPEQGRGEEVDQRADIYSLGVIFYELLTGKKPFDGTTPNALIYQHNYEEPELPSKLRSDLPVEYQAVALKCLQKDPAQRYQDAGELAGDLERVVAGSAPMTALMSAFGTGAEEAMRRLGIRRRRIWPLVTAVLLVAGAGIGVYLYMGKKTGQDTETRRLRSELAVLDEAKPIDQGAPDNLKKLTGLVGEKDADVARWQGKLARVQDLRQRLGRLDASALPAAGLRREAAIDLDRYRAEIGGTGEDTARWGKRLEEAKTAENGLREQLAEFDKATAIGLPMEERLSPSLEELTRLAGKEDAQVQRHRSQIAAVHEARAGLRKGLTGLDGKEGLIPEATIASHRKDLDSLAKLSRDDDAEILRWGRRLDAATAGLTALRDNLKRFDEAGTVTNALVTALSADLKTYQSLVDPTDPALKRWQGRADECRQAIAKLRDRLSVLDKAEELPVTDLASHTESLIAFSKLVGGDDGEYQAWDRKLREHRGRHDGLKQTLTRLDQPEPLIQAEIEACDGALTTWSRLGGVAEGPRAAMAERLRKEKSELAVLRADLAGAQYVDETVITKVAALARRAGDEDQAVKRWRVSIDEYRKQEALLVGLDRKAPLPDDAQVALTAFARVAGVTSPRVKTWQAKLDRVAELTRILLPIDRVAMPPAEAAASVAELGALIGENETSVARWRGKIERVAVLLKDLRGEVPRAMILPAGADRRMRELVELVGTADEEVLALNRRMEVLLGPSKPVWATASGRDQYGLWADLAVKGVTQRFRYVPPRDFPIGSPEDEVGRDKDETSVQLTIGSAFWLADSEVTQALWSAVSGSNPSRFPGSERPVERVHFEDCRAFLLALNQTVEGLNARLPGEAEWEFACRTGDAGTWFAESGTVTEADLENLAWFAKNSRTTHDVRQRYPNKLGLFDLHGNVWEWCEDAYGEYPGAPTTDWRGRGSGQRSIRGGSWGDQAKSLRAANRLGVSPELKTVYLGLRLAVTVVWPSATVEPAKETASLP